MTPDDYDEYDVSDRDEFGVRFTGLDRKPQTIQVRDLASAQRCTADVRRAQLLLGSFADAKIVVRDDVHGPWEALVVAPKIPALFTEAAVSAHHDVPAAEQDGIGPMLTYADVIAWLSWRRLGFADSFAVATTLDRLQADLFQNLVYGTPLIGGGRPLANGTD